MVNGWTKPEFQTREGEEIFPDGDEAWWLTEMSKRAPTEAPPLEDEDGPWDDDEEEEKREELSDDDPLTSEDADDDDEAAASTNAAPSSGVTAGSLPLSGPSSRNRIIKYQSKYACV